MHRNDASTQVPASASKVARSFQLALCACVLLMTGASAQTITVVTFDNPVPPGDSGSLLNGVFLGIDFGTGQWRWEAPYDVDLTNHIYFSSATGTSRTFSFSPAPKILDSMQVFALTPGTVTLTNDLGKTVTRSVATGSMQLVTTGWTQASTTITVSYTAGWDLGVDDITYRDGGSNPVPVINLISPSSATAGGGAFTLTVNGSNFVSGSIVRWNGANRTTASVNGDQLTAQTPASDIAVAGTAQVTVFNPAPGGGTSNAQTFTINSSGGSGFSLRFHGNGVNDIDRVKIRIDDPSTSAPDPPANVGATDFTLEFWMKASAAENPAGPQPCGANINWIFGNIVFDRDRFNQDRKFGLSIGGGRFIFGVSGEGTGDLTICDPIGGRNVLDSQWHHVAVQRRRASGQMWLFVDGNLEAQGTGPGGDVSYPYHAVPGSFCGPGQDQPCTNSDPFLVIGAEKHDAGASYPSFSGWITEVRLSNNLRYLANFTRPSAPFTPDANTVALYHFAEGQGDVINDTSNARGGPSPGVRNFGGSPAGPEWVADAPFGGPSFFAALSKLSLTRGCSLLRSGSREWCIQRILLAARRSGPRFWDRYVDVSMIPLRNMIREHLVVRSGAACLRDIYDGIRRRRSARIPATLPIRGASHLSASNTRLLGGPRL